MGKSRLVRGAVRLHRGAARAGHVAAGPLSALRGGDRVLGVGRDREGGVRGSSSRTRRTRRRRSWRRVLPQDVRGSALAAGTVGAAGRVARGEPAAQEESFTAWRRFLESAGRGRADGAGVRGPALGRPGAARLPRAPGRLGGGRAAARPVHGAAGAVRAASGLGGGLPATRTRINLAPLTDEETAQPGLGRCWSGRCCRRRRSSRCWSGRAATRCTRRSSCACSPTAGEPGARRCEVPDSVQALIAARLDTLPHGAQGPAPGRGGDGEGVLGGRAGGDGRPRPARGRAGACTSWRARSWSARPGSLDGGRGRVRLLAPARPRCRLRPDPPRRPRRRAPRSRSLDRAEGGRAGRGPGRRARLPLPGRARARPGRRPHRGARAGRRSALRYLALGRRAGARPRRGPGRAQPRPSARRSPATTTRSGHCCWSAGHRPRCSRAAARGDGTRSSRPSASTATGWRQPRRRPDAQRTQHLSSSRLADPRQGETLDEALQLLEAEPPGPRAGRRLQPAGAGPRRLAAPLRRRSRPPTGRSVSPSSSTCPSRRTRSATAAIARAYLGERAGGGRDAPSA